MIGGPADSACRGAVWVYQYNASSTKYEESQKLIGQDGSADCGGEGGSFGWSVALSSSGNTALIGGYRGDPTAGGQVWTYMRSGFGYQFKEGQRIRSLPAPKGCSAGASRCQVTAIPRSLAAVNTRGCTGSKQASGHTSKR